MGINAALIYGLLMPLLPVADQRGAARVSTVDGRTCEGVVSVWQSGGTLRLRMKDGTETEIASRDIDRVVFLPSRSRRPTGAWRVETSAGDRLFGDIIRGNAGTMTLRHHELGEIDLRLDRLSTIARRGAAANGSVAEVEDQVLLANGDMTRGAIMAVSADGVSILVSGETRERDLPWKVVRTIHFARSEVPAPDARAIRLRFDDGAELRVKSWNRRKDSVLAILPNRQSVTFDAGFAAFAEVMGGRRIWLTELRPASDVSIPFFNRRWPLVVDANAVGGPLAIAGEPYARGLGLHAACRIRWRLDGTFERLTALVGIDDSAGERADADVVISMDGRVLGRYRGLRYGQAPRPITLDLRGGQELTVEVGFGLHGDVQDRVDLVNPALIRRPATPDP
ncbi:MAG: NPCBM/NEW2 domain-containing protein [Phycisphaerae bacterium]